MCLGYQVKALPVSNIQAEGRDDDDDEIFVYMGGDQVVPDDVRRVRIDKSVTIIPRDVFYHREHLIDVEFHDGIEMIGKWAFKCCRSLRSVKLMGVKIIAAAAFYFCTSLIDLEFGDKLETIGTSAFQFCTSLRSVIIPSVKTIGKRAFATCRQLTDLDLPEGLETIQERAFSNCHELKQIAMPLNCNCVVIAIELFWLCPKLITVDLVGGFHNTVASLHLDSWRNEMKDEINHINQVLPNTDARRKTAEIKQWMGLVTRRLNHFKVEHKAMLKEATTLLELALWKADLNEKEEGLVEREGVRTTRGRRKRARKEICITSGASIVIKNVLPFLELK
ncbi:leucine-rich repeat domain-containing protein [Skeletonema marinoi]|uniref:Leucine-rich repeat domain-containing protein n=1 Tax=Skeletonema marinoi TaxID=267567 RepID=A0AAD8YCR3_9STRA|nr:leucine-rich repeat domain-containing protein [Skeletonema marinoi]